MASKKYTFQESVALGTHAAWTFRRELLLTLALVNAYGWLTTAGLARLMALTGTSVIILLLYAIPPTRRFLNRELAVGRLERRWTKACIRAGAHEPQTRSRRHPDYLGPRVTRIERARSGERLHVIGNIPVLEQYAPLISRHLDGRRHPVSEVRVMPDTRRSSRALVTVIQRDPFENAPSLPWPPLVTGLDDISVWEPVTVGTFEEGEPFRLDLVGKGNILVGGLIGSGKSVFMRPLLATVALDPHACLWLLDAKLTELHPWAACAATYTDADGEKQLGFVGRDGKRALELLRMLRAVADERQREIVANGADKIRRADKLPVHIVVIDELAAYAELPEGGKIQDAIRDLAAVGRALGITIIAATQVPHSDVIDTPLRNQFPTRIAFRCADRHHAGTILGQSDAVAAVSTISARLPGVGYALGETGVFSRFRSVLIGRPDDEHPERADDVQTLVEVAAGRRVESELQVPVGGAGSGKTSPKGRGDGTGSGTGAGKDETTGHQGRVSDVMAALMEHLSEEPLRGQELAVRLGRHRDDKTVRRALQTLAEQGACVRTDAGWVRVEPEGGRQDGDAPGGTPD